MRIVLHRQKSARWIANVTCVTATVIGMWECVGGVTGVGKEIIFQLARGQGLLEFAWKDFINGEKGIYLHI